MFGEREACPALVNGSIPARRPGGSVAEGRYLADEETIHYGFIPRTNRGVFACNELPDLTADSRNKAPFPGRGRSLRPNSDVPPVPTSGRRNAPATRDLRHAVVSGTRGSVDGRRALRRATIRLRRAKGPPHGLVITWRAHRAPFRGALARAARGRAPRTVHALHPPSHGRQPRGHFSSASARASFAARQRGTYSSAAMPGSSGGQAKRRRTASREVKLWQARHDAHATVTTLASRS